MKSWLTARKARAGKPAVRLSIEALEDRLVPAAVAATHVATNLSQLAKASAVTPLATAAATATPLPAKVTGMEMPLAAGQLGTPDWAAAWADTLARLAQPQDDNAAAATGKAAGPDIAVADTAGSDAAWIANLQQQFNQGSSGQDLVGKLIQADSQAASTLSDRILGEAGQAMIALRDALQAAGVSQHDLDRLFGGGGPGESASGGANSSVPFGHSGGGGAYSSEGGGGRMPDAAAVGASPLLTSLFGSRGQGDGWSSQLPFLSVTQGQDPIQVGAAHPGVDWRAADEPGPDCTTPPEVRKFDQGGGSASTSTDGGKADSPKATPSTGSNSGSTRLLETVNGDPFQVRIKELDKDGHVTASGYFILGPDGSPFYEEGCVYSSDGKATCFFMDESGKIEYFDLTKMPNPEGEDPRVAPAIPGVSDQSGPKNVGAGGAADGMGFVPGAGRGGWMSDRLAQSLVAWLGSTVNPNPGGAGGSAGDGSGHLPVTGLGPHGGDDPTGAAAGGHGNVHPGGNPVIVFGIGGPGPGVGPGPKVN
jgi:hypothetical protein